MIRNLRWLGHASFRINGEKRIYVDPWKVDNNGEKADIILITHEHYDHCSAKDIYKVADENTVILVTPGCQSNIPDFPGKVKLIEPDKQYDINGITIVTVPAYNTNKQFHPKENGWVGYIVQANGKRYYFAGDTDIIPEMKSLKDIDVAMLPVGGTYTMDAIEAAKAANMITPRIVVPMHWGDIVGSINDVEKFKGLCKCNVDVLERR